MKGMSATTIDPRDLMRASAMSGLQRKAVFATVALAAVDGFDILAASFAAPGISAEWKLDKTAVGLFLSAGLMGMAAGSFLLAPFGDLWGRRRLVFLSLALMALGMGMGAMASGLPWLTFWRIVCGLGIGTMVSVINPIATEFANARWRDLAVSTMAVGLPMGGVIGGIAGTLLLREYDWRVLFWIGAGLSLAMAPIVWAWLPEPLSFLIEKPNDRSLERVNALLARCGLQTVASLPPPRVTAARQRLSSLFGPENLAITVRVTVVNLLHVVAAYFLIGWVPQIVADLGHSQSDAASVSLTLSGTGILGGVLFGMASAYKPVRLLAASALCLLAVFTIAFCWVSAELGTLRVLAGFVGFFLFAGSCAMHSAVSRSFGDHVRATGAGFVFGIGRVGSSIAPLVTGWLFSIGVGRQGISLALAAGLVLAGLLLATLSTLKATEAPRKPPGSL